MMSRRRCSSPTASSCSATGRRASKPIFSWTGLTRAIGRDAGKFLDGLIPLGRHGRAEEIGQLVLYLASGQSSFSTGGVFMADGGMSI